MSWLSGPCDPDSPPPAVFIGSPVDDDEDLEFGFRLLRALAEDPLSDFEELSPGVYIVSREPGDDSAR